MRRLTIFTGRTLTDEELTTAERDLEACRAHDLGASLTHEALASLLQEVRRGRALAVVVDHEEASCRRVTRVLLEAYLGSHGWFRAPNDAPVPRVPGGTCWTRHGSPPHHLLHLAHVGTDFTTEVLALARYEDRGPTRVLVDILALEDAPRIPMRSSITLVDLDLLEARLGPLPTYVPLHARRCTGCGTGRLLYREQDQPRLHGPDERARYFRYSCECVPELQRVPVAIDPCWHLLTEVEDRWAGPNLEPRPVVELRRLIAVLRAQLQEAPCP